MAIRTTDRGTLGWFKFIPYLKVKGRDPWYMLRVEKEI